MLALLGVLQIPCPQRAPKQGRQMSVRDGNVAVLPWCRGWSLVVQLAPLGFHPSPDFCTPFLSFPVSPVGKEHPVVFHSSASPRASYNPGPGKSTGCLHSNEQLTWKPKPWRDVAVGAGGVCGSFSYSYHYNC